MSDEFDKEDPTNPAHYAEEPAEETASEGEPEGEKPELTEIERIAKQVGWFPADEYRGPKEKWRSAEDFLKKGAEISQEFKARLELKDREFNERIRRSERMAEVSLERQKKQLEDHYKAQMRYAASQGDMEVYSAVERARDQALESFDKEIAPIKETPAADPTMDPATVAFVTRNSTWFNVDKVMTGAAVALCGDLQERHPTLPLAAVMTMVEENLRREFPHKFRTNGEQPKGPPRVEGGQRPIKTSVKKGWDQLPAEAKRDAARQIERGLFGSDPAKAKQEYAAAYWADGE